MIDVQSLPARRRFLHQSANATHDLGGAVAVPDDASESLARLLQVGRLRGEPVHSGAGICDCRGDRLVDLMGDRGGQCSHGSHTRDVCEFRLGVLKRFLRVFPIGQVEHERHALLASIVERRHAEKDGHAAAVFAEELLLERLDCLGRLHLVHCPCVGVAPFRRRQVRPAHAARDEIRTLVSQHPEERVVRLEDPTIER